MVPGGGAALLACVGSLEALALPGDEAVGVGILAWALAEPMRALVRNAGLEPGPILDRARDGRCVYDVVRRDWVDAWSAGLVDPLAVVVAALETSVSAAISALGTDVLIHRPHAPPSIQP